MHSLLADKHRHIQIPNYRTDKHTLYILRTLLYSDHCWKRHDTGIFMKHNHQQPCILPACNGWKCDWNLQTCTVATCQCPWPWSALCHHKQQTASLVLIKQIIYNLASFWMHFVYKHGLSWGQENKTGNLPWMLPATEAILCWRIIRQNKREYIRQNKRECQTE